MDIVPAATATAPSAAGPLAAPLETCDAFLAAASPRYCPTQALQVFALLMAGHGRCVNTDMMLGDREYAMWQLGCARALDDAQLSALAARLFAYFDDPLHTGMVVQGTA